MMKTSKIITAFILMLSVSLLTACGLFGIDDDFFVRSWNGPPGELDENTITVSAESQEYDITESRTVKFTVGIGSTSKRSMYIGKSVWVQVTAEGCTIMEQPDQYLKEYPDFYEEDIYYPDVKEKYWGPPELTPNYYEDIYITFPEGDCSGKIKMNLILDPEGDLLYQPYLEFFYASNGSVLLIDNRAMFGVDEDGEAIRTH